jgi:hypothetical protein
MGARPARVLALGLAATLSSACALIVGIKDHHVAANGAIDGGNPGTLIDATAGPDASGATDAGEEDAEPLSFVQANADSITGSSLTLSFLSLVRPSSAIVVVLSYYDVTPAATVGIHDSIGSTYQLVGPFHFPTATQYIALATNVRGGSAASVTVDLSQASDLIEFWVHEYRGIDTQSPVLGQISGQSTGDTDPACMANHVDCMRSGRLRVDAPHAMIFGLGLTGGCTEGTNFRLRSDFHENVTEDRFVDGPGDYEATATLLGGSDTQMIAVGFRGSLK